MIELIKDDKIVKCIKTSEQFQKLLDYGYIVKEEEKQEKEEVKKPVRKRRTTKKES